MLSLTCPVGYECINALLVPPFPSHECLPFPSPYLRWPIKCGYFLVTVMWTQHCGVVWLLCNRVIPSSTALLSKVPSPSSSLSESTVISSSSFQYSTVVQIPLHPLLHLSASIVITSCTRAQFLQPLLTKYQQRLRLQIKLVSCVLHHSAIRELSSPFSTHFLCTSRDLTLRRSKT